MYSLNLLAIALELARDDPAYEDVASKFWEHFLYIADAMNSMRRRRHRPVGRGGRLLLRRAAPARRHARAAEGALDGRADPAVRGRDARARAARAAAGLQAAARVVRRASAGSRPATSRACGRRAAASGGCCRSSTRDRLRARAAGACSTRASSCRRTASARCRGVTRTQPYVLRVDGIEHRVDYEPGESTTGLFGGNSNWRGPIWFPVNYLLIESLQKFHHYFGDDFKVECPTGSGQMHDARRGRRASCRAGCRASSCATATAGGRCSAAIERFQQRPALARPACLFYEYFHGDTGRGRRRQPPDRLDGRWSPSCCSRAGE